MKFQFLIPIDFWFRTLGPSKILHTILSLLEFQRLDCSDLVNEVGFSNYHMNENDVIVHGHNGKDVGLGQKFIRLWLEGQLKERIDFVW